MAKIDNKPEGKTALQGDILEMLLNSLRELPITEAELKRPKKFAHEKLVRHLSEFVSRSAGVFITQSGERFMDVTIRRTNFWHDRILFAAEVDTWDFPLGNWTKLMDTRADVRLWVFLIPDEKSEERFNTNFEKIRELAVFRKETPSDLSPFVCVLKTPTNFVHRNLTV